MSRVIKQRKTDFFDNWLRIQNHFQLHIDYKWYIDKKHSFFNKYFDIIPLNSSIIIIEYLHGLNSKKGADFKFIKFEQH